MWIRTSLIGRKDPCSDSVCVCTLYFLGNQYIYFIYKVTQLFSIFFLSLGKCKSDQPHLHLTCLNKPELAETIRTHGGWEMRWEQHLSPGWWIIQQRGFLSRVHSRLGTHTQSGEQTRSQGENQLKSWQIFVHYVKTVMTQEAGCTAGSLMGHPSHVDACHATWRAEFPGEFYHHCFIIESESESSSEYLWSVDRELRAVKSSAPLLSLVLKRKMSSFQRKLIYLKIRKLFNELNIKYLEKSLHLLQCCTFNYCN